MFDLPSDDETESDFSESEQELEVSADECTAPATVSAEHAAPGEVQSAVDSPPAAAGDASNAANPAALPLDPDSPVDFSESAHWRRRSSRPMAPVEHIDPALLRAPCHGPKHQPSSKPPSSKQQSPCTALSVEPVEKTVSAFLQPPTLYGPKELSEAMSADAECAEIEAGIVSRRGVLMTAGTLRIGAPRFGGWRRSCSRIGRMSPGAKCSGGA